MSTVTLVQTNVPPTLVDSSLTQATPPIVHVIRVAFGILSTLFSAISLLSMSTWTIIKTALAPLRYLFFGLSTPVLYILSPVIILASIIVEVFIIGPYSLAVGFLRTIYPIYVFVGAACIVAAVVGLCARGAAQFLHASIFERDATRAEAVAPALKAGVARPKTPKKVSIKEEADIRTVPSLLW